MKHYVSARFSRSAWVGIGITIFGLLALIIAQIAIHFFGPEKLEILNNKYSAVVVGILLAIVIAAAVWNSLKEEIGDCFRQYYRR